MPASKEQEGCLCALVSDRCIDIVAACRCIVPDLTGSMRGSLSHIREALVCLLAILSLASSCAARAAVISSTAAQSPQPSTGVQQPPAQSAAQQQIPGGSNLTQFPASADSFLKALRDLQDAHSLFQASTYNPASGAQWWAVGAADVPKMRSQAALFAAGLKTSAGSFGGMFAQLVAQASPLCVGQLHHTSPML